MDKTIRREKQENRKCGPGNDWTHQMYQRFRVLHSVCCPLIILLLVLFGFKTNERHQLYFKSNPIQPIKQTTKKAPPPFFPSNRLPKNFNININPTPQEKPMKQYTCWNFQTQTLWLQSNPSNPTCDVTSQELAIETVLEWQFNTELHRRCQTPGSVHDGTSSREQVSQVANKPLRMVIFLQGSLGNFMRYQHGIFKKNSLNEAPMTATFPGGGGFLWGM